MSALALSLPGLEPEVAPAAPLNLVTTAHPSLHHHPGPLGELVHPRLGRLITPRHTSSVAMTAAAGIPWAADNDCFQGLDVTAFLAMLNRIQGLPGCLFVSVPDVVADAHATAVSFEKWAPAVERRGLPVALVLQDGLETPAMRAWLARTWHRLDAVFVGGSTEWKLGPIAKEFANEAKRRDKWVHWGRVNTRLRIHRIIAGGAADSYDGTKWARWRNKYLADELDRLAVDAALADAYGNDSVAFIDTYRARKARRRYQPKGQHDASA
jgi:hypothetical protein